jgi:hypothetical protein
MRAVGQARQSSIKWTRLSCRAFAANAVRFNEVFTIDSTKRIVPDQAYLQWFRLLVLLFSLLRKALPDYKLRTKRREGASAVARAGWRGSDRRRSGRGNWLVLSAVITPRND